jgi:hypothetical protein
MEESGRKSRKIAKVAFESNLERKSMSVKNHGVKQKLSVFEFHANASTD